MNGAADAGPDELTVSMAAVDAAAARAVLADRLRLCGVDLEHPVENNTYEELSPLLLRLEQQRRRIRGACGQAPQRVGAVCAISR